MKTVLQIIPTLGAGGAEQAVIDITAGLVAAGHRALVVSSGGPRVAEIEHMGATHKQMPVNSKNPFTILSNARWLKSYLREQNVDIIHARSRAPAWSAYLATRQSRTLYMTTFHAAYKFNSSLKKSYNRVMTKGERIIAISHFIAEHIQENYQISPEKIRTIPRSLDFSKFSRERITQDRQNKLCVDWNVPMGSTLILCPARLSPIKGHTTLIEAFARLSNSTAIVIIVGDDQGRTNYRQELERLIHARGLNQRVRLVAHCSDMPAAYSLASLVVAPSLVSEGFGRVPLEAMAMEVPVIASALGGHCETIRSGENGWLFSPQDIDQLSFMIGQGLSLPKNTKIQMMQKARLEAAAKYDKKKMIADTLDVYSELLGQP